MLQYYNRWGSEKLVIVLFSKRVNNHIKAEKKRINGRQLICISGYKWNTDFKNDYSNCEIQDF